MTNPRVTRKELLSPVSRYTALRKSEICDGIRRGTISIDEAKIAHDITSEELMNWLELYQSKGVRALRNVEIKQRRRPA